MCVGLLLSQGMTKDECLRNDESRMTKDPPTPPRVKCYDLEERAAKFAEVIIRFAKLHLVFAVFYRGGSKK